MGASHFLIAVELDGEGRRAVVVGPDGATLLNRVLDDVPTLVGEVAARGPALMLFEEPAALDGGVVEAARAAGADVAYVAGAAARREREPRPDEPREPGRLATLLAEDVRRHPELLRAPIPTDTEAASAAIEADRTAYQDVLRYLGQLRLFLEQRYPEVAKVLGPHLDHPAVDGLLERYSTPDDMRTAGRRRLRGMLRELSPDAADTLVTSLMAALALPESRRETPNVERVIPSRAALVRTGVAQRTLLADRYAALLPAHALANAESHT